VKWPSEHQHLVDELLAEYGHDEDALRDVLVRVGLKTIAAAQQVTRRRPESEDDDADSIPTPIEVVASCGEPLGLGIRSVIAGRPTSAVLFATDGPVVIGEEENTRVVVGSQGVRAIIRSQLARGRSGSAVFTVAAKDLRMRYEFAPEGHDVLVFVLRSESRALVMTRGEVREVHDALEAGRKLERFSLAADGALRISMPKKPTGLDLAFPRVAKWDGSA
jgi:hypothetical protein